MWMFNMPLACIRIAIRLPINASTTPVCVDEFEILRMYGCGACNYSALATDDAGIYADPESGYNCDGICIM